MKLNSLFLRTLGVLTLFITLFSCEDDFQNVGSNLVDATNFSSDSVSLAVKAYSEPFFNGRGVQTSGISLGALGYLKEPLYGNTTASVVSQVVMSSNNPNFGVNPVLDSVVFSLPYFSRSSVNAEGQTVFTLDSVFGNSPIKLTGYRSNYFLSQNNPPDFTENAIYYSNQLDQFNGLEGDLLFEIPSLTISNSPVITTVPAAADAADQSPTVTTNSPRIRLLLDDNYWQQAILNRGGEDVLFNDNSFRDYFRGIYLKAEPINDDGTYFLFNMTSAVITLYYKSGEAESRSQKEFSLNLNTSVSGRTISVIGYKNDFKEDTKTAVLANTDKDTGAENLYLKGGQGSMAVVELFGPDDDGNGIPDDLEALRANNWLIREANLEFFVDQDKIAELAGADINEPNRIYIYNLATNQPLLDFSLDSNTNQQTGAITAVGTNHLGPLRRDANGDGISYKIRITEYLKLLLDPGNENPQTKLGVVVTQNPQVTATGAIQNTTSQNRPSRLPFGSILSQQGTVLHGSQSNDENKRIKLKIFFTEAF